MEQLPWLATVGNTLGLHHAFSTVVEGNQGFGFGSAAAVVKNRDRFLRAAREAADALLSSHARMNRGALPRAGRYPAVGGLSAFYLSKGAWMVPMRAGCEEVISVVGPTEAGRGAMAPDSGPLGEAMITTSSGIHLGVASADCAPVIIFDPVRRALALVHAGRESTVREICGKTVKRLVELGTDPRDLVVGIGPGIRKESYLLQTFAPAADAVSAWRQNNRCVIMTEGVLLDLPGRNRDILVERGVPPGNIEVSPANTFLDKQFFSHRRTKATGDPEGRHACVVWMAPV